MENGSVLERFGIETKEKFFSKAFARNTGLLSLQEQKKLESARIAIPGMGGVGGSHLITLVRTGVGNFNIADFDEFEPVNINRQYGATVTSFGKQKIETMQQEALSINPYLDIKLFKDGINNENMDDFLDGVDVVIDSLDFFNFDTRRALFKRAWEKGIYVVTAGPLGFSSALLVFSPTGIGFDEYFNIYSGITENEKLLSFAMGLTPRPTHIKYMDMNKIDFESKEGPSLGIACQICAGLAATETVKIILKRGTIKPVPYFLQFDPYLRKINQGRLFKGNKNPVQIAKKKIFNYLITRNKQVFRPEIPEKPLEVLGDNGQISPSAFNYLINAGSYAPSGDNCQPWKFETTENTLNIYLDKAVDNSFFNVNQIASKISCGAVIENIKTASKAIGLEVETSYGPFSHMDLMAALSFKSITNDKSENKGEDKKESLKVDSIWKRNTNRKLYKKKGVHHSTLLRVKSDVTSVPGAKINFITKREDIKKIAEIVYQADRIRTESKSLHEHLMSMIRFTDEEAISKKDGFHIKNLEAGLPGEAFLKATRDWSIMNIANNLGFGRIVAKNSYDGIINSSGVGLITIEGFEDSDFVRGGEALEKAWLNLASHEISFQPMTAITLFFLRYNLNGKEEFPEDHQKIMESIAGDYNSLFKEVDLNKNAQIMLFRFGYSKDIKYRTLRKGADSF